MPKERLSVVVTRRLPDVVETRMKELFDVRLRDDDAPMTRAELAEAVRDADVLVPTLTDQIDGGLIAQAGDRLRLIANYGAGVDHIDVATARQRGVLVSNTPGVSADDTADMTVALLLAVTRRIPEGLQLMQDGAWTGWSPTALLGGARWGQAARHPRHGTDRTSGGSARAGLWYADPLSQSSPPATRDGTGARSDLLGEP